MPSASPPRRAAIAILFLYAFLPWLTPLARSQWSIDPTHPPNRRLAAYFEEQTSRMENRTLDGIQTADQWTEARKVRKQQLLEMLGLSPFPEKTDLKATVTGSKTHDGFVVERLHFQSRPGLYVTANLYRPVKQEGPLPAVLYVCGHGNVRIDGVSYGSKANYQHHGQWFARNGYVCLTIDTLQLGEIEGIHHGTYRYDRYWWLNRGYTPAGVEAWNSIRALDYLQSREEVDPEQLGVTGRSGGGAYSWWLASIDERIKAAVPVAGTTDLRNHVVDGCVEGHCDCMFMVNTYQWDYPTVAAMVAPRALLLSNTDDDRIFPLEGVVRTHREVRDVYRLVSKPKDFALHITAGPHKDTQELRVHAFQWFNRHLKQDESLIRMPAEKLLDPRDLKVFDELPKDEINTTIDEHFVAQAPPAAAPATSAEWDARVKTSMEQLREKTFRPWPRATDKEGKEDKGATLEIKSTTTDASDELELKRIRLVSQSQVELDLWILRGKSKPTKLTVLNVVDTADWNAMKKMAAHLLPNAKFATESERKDADSDSNDAAKEAEQTKRMLTALPWAMAYVAPRGLGEDQWHMDDRKHNQVRRRFYLLGQTIDGMRIWDIVQATRVLRQQPETKAGKIWLQAEGSMADLAVHAALFEKYGRVDLYDLAPRYRDGATLLNVSRFLTMPETVAMAAAKSPVVIYNAPAGSWDRVNDIGKTLKWDKKRFQLRQIEDAAK